MKALDTNVLVRFFVDDPDDAQSARQRSRAIEALSERGYVPLTVMLELEWVLRGFYELPPKEIARVIRALASIDHIALENRDAVLNAVNSLMSGIDFADALHVACSGRAAALVTFDAKLAKRATKLQLTPPVELLT